MVAPVVDGILVDTNDAGNLLGEIVVPVGYLVGDVLPGTSSASPPVVTILSPATPGPAAKTAALIFTVVDPQGLTLERAMVRSGGDGAKWEQAYRDGAACAGYSVTRTTITDGYRYEITREGGWNTGALELEPIFGDPTASASINS